MIFLPWSGDASPPLRVLSCVCVSVCFSLPPSPPPSPPLLPSLRACTHSYMHTRIGRGHIRPPSGLGSEIRRPHRYIVTGVRAFVQSQAFAPLSWPHVHRLHACLQLPAVLAPFACACAFSAMPACRFPTMLQKLTCIAPTRPGAVGSAFGLTRHDLLVVWNWSTVVLCFLRCCCSPIAGKLLPWCVKHSHACARAHTHTLSLSHLRPTG